MRHYTASEQLPARFFIGIFPNTLLTITLRCNPAPFDFLLQGKPHSRLRRFDLKAHRPELALPKDFARQEDSAKASSRSASSLVRRRRSKRESAGGRCRGSCEPPVAEAKPSRTVPPPKILARRDLAGLYRAAGAQPP